MNIYYDVVVHTQKRNYVSDPNLWDKRKLKKFLRRLISCDDVCFISVGKLKKLNKSNSFKMVCDRLFIQSLSDVRRMK